MICNGFAGRVNLNLVRLFNLQGAKSILIIDSDSPFVSRELELFFSDDGMTLYPDPTVR